jgi:colanic acid biosynthesis glycosyl transferase WcaI
MYFLPDFGSAPILINELAEGLAERGRDVEVVTTLPRERTGGFKGGLCPKERTRGFVVKRFRTNRGPNPLSRLMAWNLYTAGTLANLFSLRKGDIAFLRTPPLQLGLTGLLARKLRGARVLLNVQDIHPDLSIQSGILKNPLAIRFAQALEKWVYRVSDHILVISEGFRQNLLAKGVPPDKLSIIPNWVDTDFMRPLPKDNPVSRRFSLQDKFVIMYSGTISISSNLALERVLDAAGRLKGEKDILFVIVGEGLKKESLEEKARGLGLSNVLFLPFQPYRDLPDLLASSDVLLVPLDKEKSQISVPSKLYNFMAVGRPILGLTTPDSEVAAIIRDTESGRIAPPDESEAIAGAVMELKRLPESRARSAANARSYVVANFDKKMILDKYDELIGRIGS